jgi:hypothetical protein
MKKQLLTIGAGLLLSFSGIAQENPSTVQKLTYDVPFITSEIDIDGLLDQAYESAEWGLIINTTEAGSGVTPVDAATVDISGRFKAVYDLKNFYIFYEITDDKLVFYNLGVSPKEPWLYDNIEVFFGPANSQEADGKLIRDLGDRQYRIHAKYEGIINEWTDSELQIAPGTDGFYEETSKGYNYEVKFSWEYILRDFKGDMTPEEFTAWTDSYVPTIDIMQFETQIADNDDLENKPVRKYVVAWNCDLKNGNAYQDTRLWGFARLEGIGTSVPADVVKPTVRIFPNPVKEVVTVSGIGFNSYIIVNILGQKVAEGNLGITRDNERISTSDLRNGIYILNLYNDNKKVYSGKIIK